ncbi:MAG: hypothetical protein FJ148_17920 [Deltaproteobacteria bacterium]|nr:hypothetical protein [Deltaproteobacteria bacterium]
MRVAVAWTADRVCEGGIAPGPPPRLLDRVRASIRARHYSQRTEKAYVHWIRRYILFHGKRHPETLGAAEIESFLSALAVQGKVAASTQNQALAALLFLYDLHARAEPGAGGGEESGGCARGLRGCAASGGRASVAAARLGRRAAADPRSD